MLQRLVYFKQAVETDKISNSTQAADVQVDAGGVKELLPLITSGHMAIAVAATGALAALAASRVGTEALLDTGEALLFVELLDWNAARLVQNALAIIEGACQHPAMRAAFVVRLVTSDMLQMKQSEKRLRATVVHVPLPGLRTALYTKLQECAAELMCLVCLWLARMFRECSKKCTATDHHRALSCGTARTALCTLHCASACSMHVSCFRVASTGARVSHVTYNSATNTLHSSSQPCTTALSLRVQEAGALKDLEREQRSADPAVRAAAARAYRQCTFRHVPMAALPSGAYVPASGAITLLA